MLSFGHFMQAVVAMGKIIYDPLVRSNYNDSVSSLVELKWFGQILIELVLLSGILLAMRWTQPVLFC